MSELQSLFNRSVRGLRSQGFRQSRRNSADPFDDGGCAYRGEKGKRCAVGWLIADSRYSSSMEGASVLSSLVRRAAGVTTDREFQLISELQSAHDDTDTPAQMRAALREVAHAFDLDDSAIDERSRTP